MSSSSSCDVTCACGATVQIHKWDSVTAHINPELKNRILEGGIFSHQCGRCHQRIRAEHPLLYNDTKQDLMVWYLPAGVSDEFSEAFDSQSRLSSLDTKLRLAYSYAELAEIIKIFDQGVYDIQVAWAKLRALQELGTEEATFDDIRFDKYVVEDDDSAEFRFYFETGENAGSRFTLEANNAYECDLYEICVEINKDYDWIRLDHENLLALLGDHWDRITELNDRYVE